MNQTIPVGEYLHFAYDLTEMEQAVCRLLMDWLPETIIDAHAHCGLPEHVLGLDDKLLGHMLSTFPYFSLEQSADMHRIFFPGKKVRALRFAKPVRGIDHRAVNRYLLEKSSVDDRVALYGIPTDIEYTVEMMKHPRVSGLKMYYQFFNPPSAQIREFFPTPVLAAAEELGVPIVLHLPKMITKCQADLRQVLDDFPRLPVVLAHLGLPHLPVPGLAETYQEFARYENVCLDTAMIPSADVVDMALSAFGRERILYGSDQPLNLIRATVFDHPDKGQRLAAAYPYHWVDKADHQRFGHLAKGAMHMHWQAIGAIYEALEKMTPVQSEVARQFIFHDNAVRVFGF